MGAGVSKRFSNLPLLGVTAGDAQKNSTIQGCHMDQWGFWHPQNKNTYTQGWPEIVTEGHALPERVAADAGTGSHVLASIIFQQYKSWWLPWNFNFFFHLPGFIFCKVFPFLVHRSMSTTHDFVKPFCKPCNIPSLGSNGCIWGM